MWLLALPLLTFMAATVSALPAEPLPIGTYTNEEQVYFEAETVATLPPWIGVRIEAAESGIVWQTVDRFGAIMVSAPVRTG